ncbi:cleft lip and palate transmembrane protein 1-domain-containing protein [Tribonema minus]|uniref:Cleft lip and palate transmembrane protein 1-domain-containing protein n=1 Tax=Tribonema minus TaxID=303371 RepID=A0A836CN46_9STRA|nr:cleft lip and palate transmembrane protein 1-domain-containing protein [Tribonema minus]
MEPQEEDAGARNNLEAVAAAQGEQQRHPHLLAPVEGQQQQQQQRPSLWETILKSALLYIAFSLFTRHHMAKSVAQQRAQMEAVDPDALAEQALAPLSVEEVDVSPLKEFFGVQSKRLPQFPEYDARGRPLPLQRCTFKPGQVMDLYVYKQEGANGTAAASHKDALASGELLWLEKGLTFDWQPSNTRQKDATIPLSPTLANNGSAWAHIFLTKAGVSPDPRHPTHRPPDVTHVVHQLNTYRPLPKARKARNLLAKGGKGGGVEEEQGEGERREGEIGNFWKPTLAIQLVDMTADFQRNHIPAVFAEDIKFHAATGNYYPIVVVNEFWLQTKHYTALNATAPAAALAMSYRPVGLGKWQIMSQLARQWRTRARMGLQSESETDSIVDMLGDTSPWLLVLTFLISALHSIFDFLAFKSDVSFWRKRRSLEGLSVRSMVVNCFFQIVITLYLFDNETSYLILVSSAVGLAIELWKLGKAFSAKCEWAPGRLLPSITMTASASYAKSETRRHDETATSHLLFVVVPLVVGYTAYSLVQREHRGWYSWVLNSLTGFVCEFGFIAMTPQLFINYKLKSVAHLPWRTMVYKSLNTFIDDCFAFIIKMPWMHRLACFRDDIIFFVYLYQRWAYRTDYSRVNEYGQVMVPKPEQEAELTATTESMEPNGMPAPAQAQPAAAAALPAESVNEPVKAAAEQSR